MGEGDARRSWSSERLEISMNMPCSVVEELSVGAPQQAAQQKKGT